MLKKMDKLRVRKEQKLQSDMLEALQKQGFRAKKFSDRFKAGPPDMRIGRLDLGQLDVELKYNDWPLESLEVADEADTGMTKLQWLTIREMNTHGIPAICLIYIEARDVFVISNDKVLCNPLTYDTGMLSKLPQGQIIHGETLFSTAKEYLRERAGKH